MVYGLPFFLFLPFFFKPSGRHVEEGFGFVYHVVGDRLMVFDWGGGDERGRGRRSGFEGDDGGVGAEGGNGNGSLGLRSEDFRRSGGESGIPHLIGVVLQG